MSTFTKEQVAQLWARQFGPFDMIDNPRFHPYTCGNRGDGNHVEFGGDLGMLIPTVNGWICPCCDYTQNWSHETGRPSAKDNNSEQV